jgi:hypothetical protein
MIQSVSAKNFHSTLMSDTDIISVREQIQNDLICLLESQFGEVDYLDEVQSLACQIVVDNFTQLLNK